jgi:hypothetical protein
MGLNTESPLGAVGYATLAECPSDLGGVSRLGDLAAAILTGNRRFKDGLVTALRLSSARPPRSCLQIKQRHDVLLERRLGYGRC